VDKALYDRPLRPEPWVDRARRATYRALDPAAHPRGLSAANAVLAALIVAAVAAAVLETEPTVSRGRERIFGLLEVFFTTVFAFEFCLRFWAEAENPHLGGGWRARWRWLVSPAAIVDLLAIAPAMVMVGVAPSYLLRLFRLLRVLRLAKLGRFSRAWSLISEAIFSRRFELVLTAFVAWMVTLTSATLLYLVEGPVQPEKFGSIPRALWWAVVTLSTIGYGDVYPETLLGKILAAFTAMAGVGLIAAPTGILAAAFSDAAQRHRELEEEARRVAGDITD